MASEGSSAAAIRFGMGQWGKLRSYRLAEFTASVVAAPSLAGAVHELSVRGELPMVCLDKLEQHTRKTLAAIGLTAQADRALRVDSYRDVVQAAEEGLGVAVMYGTRKTPAAANDRLVALSSQPLPVPFALYFVCRELEAELPDIAALRAWLFKTLAAA